MTDALYDRYKEALRRGHIAALHGRPAEALTAYRQAIEIAPERAVPYVSLGGVLAGLGRRDEALAAYDQALSRNPATEPALRGRADVLIAANRRFEAAETLDRLSAAFESAGRLADACDTAREALELAESRDRRRDVERHARRLRSEGRDPASTAALGRALEILREPISHPRVVPAGTADAQVPPGTEPAAASGGEEWVAAPALASTPPPRDLMADAEAAMDGGDVEAVRAAILAASAAQRAAGLLEAALDTCYMALAVAPADPDIHLTLATLYLDRGWRTSAVDKIILLARLADLTADESTHERLAALVHDRLADEPRLVARYG